MLAKERHDTILNLLCSRGAVTTAELMEILQVSIETVRRDLLLLEKQGALQRVYGGAVTAGEMKTYSALPQRLEDNKDGKLELVETAAALVREGDVLYIDTGSTAIFFAEALKRRFSRLTVVTHSLDVFGILSQEPGFQMILCGGHYLAEENAFHGQLVLDTMKKLHVDKAFVFPSAVSLQHGVCDYDHTLLPIQMQMIAGCDRLFILADSSKFEKNGLLKLCDANVTCTYITDSNLSPRIRQLYADNDLSVLTGQEE